MERSLGHDVIELGNCPKDRTLVGSPSVFGDSKRYTIPELPELQGEKPSAGIVLGNCPAMEHAEQFRDMPRDSMGLPVGITEWGFCKECKNEYFIRRRGSTIRVVVMGDPL